MKLKEKAEEICKRLEDFYPDSACSLVYSKPHELMIAGRLSAQCTDARVNIVTKTLFERVEELIKTCGLYKTKAKSIVEMCRQLLERFDGEIPKTIEELTTLSGIGRKTANLIMGDVHKLPAIVTDTHCIRICGRLGLTKNKEPKKVEDDLRKIIPPEKSSDFCHRLVIFGRDICKARGERCGECPLSDICKSCKPCKS